MTAKRQFVDRHKPLRSLAAQGVWAVVDTFVSGSPIDQQFLLAVVRMIRYTNVLPLRPPRLKMGHYPNLQR